jgi:MFS family permease
MFGALRGRDYRWWFASQVLAASGSMTQAIGLSWLILQLSTNALYLAVLSICTWGPLMPLGPWAGALVDRVDRRRLLLLTQTLLMVFALLLAALTATGEIRLWSVFAISLATGLVVAVDGPARQVYVIDLVGSTGLASAVSLYEVVINASRVLGPAFGAVLLSTVGTASCFLLNALAFVAPIVVLLRIRVDATGHHAVAPRTPGAIRAGLSYVRHQPAILACVLMAAAGGMLFNLGIALPLLATRTFGLGSTGFGTLMAAFGLGALPGAALAATTTWPSGRRVRILAVATGLAVIGVGYAPNAVVAYAGMVLAGFASIWFIALANTLVQLTAEPAMRGRVMGVWSMALPGTIPITGLLAAWLCQAASPRLGFAAAGIALLVTVAAGWAVLGRHRPVAAA